MSTSHDKVIPEDAIVQSWNKAQFLMEEVMMQRVPGENRGKITLYALSTCGWCAKTKKLLDNLGTEYSYVYVDLLEGEERESIMNEVRRWNPRSSFPTVVVNDEVCVVGYNEQKIKKAIGM